MGVAGVSVGYGKGGDDGSCGIVFRNGVAGGSNGGWSVVCSGDGDGEGSRIRAATTIGYGVCECVGEGLSGCEGLDGSVRNAEVRDSQPDDVFDASAIRAVERWEFEPYTENGEVVETRAGVRMAFALE